MVTVDTGATLDWSGGDLSIGTGGSVTNYGTLTITTTGNFAGTVGVGGFTDYSALSSGIPALIGDQSAPTFTLYSVPRSDSGVIEGGETVSSPSEQAYSASSTLTDIFNSDGTRNTSGWWGDTDLTAIPYSVGSNGVLVTPQDMILANHFAPSIGNEVDFIGNDGTFYRRYYEAFTQVTGTDILVATLNSPLPDTGAGAVTPLNLLPADFTDYILNSGQYPAVAFVNQDRRLLVGQYDGTQSETTYVDGAFQTENANLVAQSADPVLSQFYYAVRGGDSGSPITMLINGHLTLVANWLTGSYGPNDAAYLTGINAAISANATTLTTYDGGAYAESTTYTVSTVDLSGFTDYSALL